MKMETIVANFIQVLEAKLNHNWHTQFGGFGLTLKGDALIWFQNLGRSQFHSLEALDKDFIKAFLKHQDFLKF